MANRRMISKTISVSEKLLALGHKLKNKGEFAQLLYTWLIPHVDDYGCYDASSTTLKLSVMPGSNRAYKDFEEAIVAMADVGLIRLYTVNKKNYLQVTKFDDFQTFKNDRRRQSLYPLPSSDNKEPAQEALQDSIGIQQPPNGNKENPLEGNGTLGLGLSKNKDKDIKKKEKYIKEKRKTAAPDNYDIPESIITWAAEKYPDINLNIQKEKFLDYHRAKGNKFVDWDAAFRTWMRNAAEIQFKHKSEQLPVSTTEPDEYKKFYINPEDVP